MLENKSLKKRLENYVVFKASQIDEALTLLQDSLEEDGYDNIVSTYKNVEYISLPFSFDIETSSFYDDKGRKTAIMYIWQMGINGIVIIGRTWEEFIDVLDTLSEQFELNEKRKLVIYVHNLYYEFQFMRCYLNFVEVFAVKSRTVLYCETDNFIIFKCSYLLSGYSLNNLSKNLLKYKIQKKTGDLDYSLIRHNKTPLTEKELEYCYNDVLVLNAYIQELLEDEFFNIGRIPNTKTGYVRRYVKKHCLYGDKSSHHDLPKECVRYKELIKKLTISDVREYRQLKRAFQGGFTHSNALFTGYNIENVASYDITSSYPYVMLSEKFPMSKGTLINPENRKSEKEIRNYLDNFCCIFAHYI